MNKQDEAISLIDIAIKRANNELQNETASLEAHTRRVEELTRQVNTLKSIRDIITTSTNSI